MPEKRFDPRDPFWFLEPVPLRWQQDFTGWCAEFARRDAACSEALGRVIRGVSGFTKINRKAEK